MRVIAALAILAAILAAQSAHAVKGAACHASIATKMHCEDRIYPDLRRDPNFFVTVPNVGLFNYSIYK